MYLRFSIPKFTGKSSLVHQALRINSVNMGNQPEVGWVVFDIFSNVVQTNL